MRNENLKLARPQTNEIRDLCRRAYSERGERAPAEMIDDYLARSANLEPGDGIEYRRAFKRIAVAWLAYARDRNGGDLPESLTPHSSETERATLVCANDACGASFEVLPCEVREGRRYCSLGCASTLHRRGSRLSDEERRNRNLEIYRRVERDGEPVHEVAADIGLQVQTARKIVVRVRRERNEEAA